jgi:hypothetical protein
MFDLGGSYDIDDNKRTNKYECCEPRWRKSQASMIR